MGTHCHSPGSQQLKRFASGMFRSEEGVKNWVRVRTIVDPDGIRIVGTDKGDIPETPVAELVRAVRP